MTQKNKNFEPMKKIIHKRYKEIKISGRFQDLVSNWPYCLPNNTYDISSENLVLDQLTTS